ncbi:MAG: hypothetical protein Q8S84_01515 [bacterium]|nr:hypothetical protein [bacterium]MDP3380245.1 hypothetical protein [bacterium]
MFTFFFTFLYISSKASDQKLLSTFASNNALSISAYFACFQISHSNGYSIYFDTSAL